MLQFGFFAVIQCQDHVFGWSYWPHIPKGSKDPNNRVSGPKYYSVHGIWALKPHYLGPRTLRDTFQSPCWVGRSPVTCCQIILASKRQLYGFNGKENGNYYSILGLYGVTRAQALDSGRSSASNFSFLCI